MTQKQLAEIVGTSATSILTYESTVFPKVDMLCKIADALCCTVNWLIYGDKNENCVDTNSFDSCEKGRPNGNIGERMERIEALQEALLERLCSIEVRMRNRELEDENERLKSLLDKRGCPSGECSAGGC